MISNEIASIRIVGASGCKEGKGENQYAQPRGVCINKVTKEIFIVDCNNHRIQVLHLHSLAFIRQIGKGVQGNAPGFLMYPVGICMDETDHIFVADTNNHRIVVFNHLTGGFIRTIGSQGSNIGCLNCPYGICVDVTSGYLFVADYENNRVQIFDGESGDFIKVFGQGQGNSPGQFNQPIDVCIDYEHDRLFVADYSNNRVQVLSKETGTFIRSIGATSGSDSLSGPRSLCINHESGLLLISDRENHRIQLFEKNTFQLLRHIGNGQGTNPGQFNRPMEMCIDNEEGVLIVVDGYNHRVQIIELPELQKEKQRLKLIKRMRQEASESVPEIFPSRVAIATEITQNNCFIKSSDNTDALLLFPDLGPQYVTQMPIELIRGQNIPHMSDLQRAKENDSFNHGLSMDIDGVDSEISISKTLLNRQAEIFMTVLDGVASNFSKESILFIAPPLLALQSLMLRGWKLSKISVNTTNMLLTLLLNLNNGSVGDTEKLAIMKAIVAMLKSAITIDKNIRAALVPRIVQYLSVACDSSANLPPVNYHGSLPINGILFSLLELTVTGIQLIDPFSNGQVQFLTHLSSILSNENIIKSKYSDVSGNFQNEVIELILGTKWYDAVTNTKRKLKSNLQNNLASRDLLLPRSFAPIIESLISLKSLNENISQDSTDKSLEFVVCACKHIGAIHLSERKGQDVKDTESSTRGGRHIWTPPDALAIGDLIDCMDKEKSWFESIVIDIQGDGAVKVHFLGWGSKWDDSISISEIPQRIAQLNSRTKNWRADLFVGGLIEIKCNDDLVNQKWMWAKITKLNVEEQWLEVVYSFSNEPTVIKKAWLYGENLCPVGMHTKDKSKAAAAAIVKPGKSVREILAEKTSSGSNDSHWYDLEDDFRETEVPSLISRGFSVGLIEPVASREFSIAPTNLLIAQASLELKQQSSISNDHAIFQWICSYIFSSLISEISTLLSSSISKIFTNALLTPSALLSDESEALDRRKSTILEFFRVFNRTSWRKLISPCFIRNIYFQSGLLAKSFSLKYQQIRIFDESSFSKVVDFSHHLGHASKAISAFLRSIFEGTIVLADTINYIEEKLHLTVKHCGFRSLANDLIVSLIQNDDLLKVVFEPLTSSRRFHERHLKKRRDFSYILSSASKIQSEKLFNYLENTLIRRQLDCMDSPTVYFKTSSAMNDQAAQLYWERFLDTYERVKSSFDHRLLIKRVLFATDRVLLEKLAGMGRSDAIVFAKALATFLSASLSKAKTTAVANYPSHQKDVDIPIAAKVSILLKIIDNAEIAFYFNKYYLSLLCSRLAQGDYSSLVAERVAVKDLSLSVAVDDLANQVEQSELINLNFSRFLLNQVDNDRIEPSCFIENVIKNKALNVCVFKSGSWFSPGGALSAVFDAMKLPDEMKTITQEFNVFYKERVKGSSPKRLIWCLGVGQMRLNCIFNDRKVCSLTVNEPQCVVLFAIRNSPAYCLTLNELAAKTNIPLDILKTLVLSLVNVSDKVRLLVVKTAVGRADSDRGESTDASALTASSVITLSVGPRRVHTDIDHYDCSKRFWNTQDVQINFNAWRHLVIDASVLKELKKESRRRDDSHSTVSSFVLVGMVKERLRKAHPTSVFSDREIIQRFHHLVKSGVIYYHPESPATGEGYSAFASSHASLDSRHSQKENKPNEDRSHFIDIRSLRHLFEEKEIAKDSEDLGNSIGESKSSGSISFSHNCHNCHDSVRSGSNSSKKALKYIISAVVSHSSYGDSLLLSHGNGKNSSLRKVAELAVTWTGVVVRALSDALTEKASTSDFFLSKLRGLLDRPCPILEKGIYYQALKTFPASVRRAIVDALMSAVAGIPGPADINDIDKYWSSSVLIHNNSLHLLEEPLNEYFAYLVEKFHLNLEKKEELAMFAEVGENKVDHQEIDSADCVPSRQFEVSPALLFCDIFASFMEFCSLKAQNRRQRENLISEMSSRLLGTIVDQSSRFECEPAPKGAGAKPQLLRSPSSLLAKGKTHFEQKSKEIHQEEWPRSHRAQYVQLLKQALSGQDRPTSVNSLAHSNVANSLNADGMKGRLNSAPHVSKSMKSGIEAAILLIDFKDSNKFFSGLQVSHLETKSNERNDETLGAGDDKDDGAQFASERGIFRLCEEFFQKALEEIAFVLPDKCQPYHHHTSSFFQDDLVSLIDCCLYEVFTQRERGKEENLSSDRETSASDHCNRSNENNPKNLIWWAEKDETSILSLIEQAILICTKVAEEKQRGTDDNDDDSQRLDEITSKLRQSQCFALPREEENGGVSDNTSPENCSLKERYIESQLDLPFPMSYNEMVSTVAGVLNMHWSSASHRLARHEWDINSVVNSELVGNQTSRSFYSSSEALTDVLSPPRRLTRLTCFSCSCQCEASNMLSLRCGHVACKKCWCNHIERLVSDCPHAELFCERQWSEDCATIDQCKEVVEADFLLFLMGEDFCVRYLQNLARHHSRVYYEANKQDLFSSNHFKRVADSSTLSCLLCQPDIDKSTTLFVPSATKTCINDHKVFALRIKECISDNYTALLQCQDSKEFAQSVIKCQFWRLYLDLQYLLDHCPYTNKVDNLLISRMRVMLTQQVERMTTGPACSESLLLETSPAYQNSILATMKLIRSKILLLYEKNEYLGLKKSDYRAAVDGIRPSSLSSSSSSLSISLGSFGGYCLPRRRSHENRDNELSELSSFSVNGILLKESILFQDINSLSAHDFLKALTSLKGWLDSKIVSGSRTEVSSATTLSAPAATDSSTDRTVDLVISTSMVWPRISENFFRFPDHTIDSLRLLLEVQIIFLKVYSQRTIEHIDFSDQFLIQLTALLTEEEASKEVSLVEYVLELIITTSSIHSPRIAANSNTLSRLSDALYRRLLYVQPTQQPPANSATSLRHTLSLSSSVSSREFVLLVEAIVSLASLSQRCNILSAADLHILNLIDACMRFPRDSFGDEKALLCRLDTGFCASICLLVYVKPSSKSAIEFEDDSYCSHVEGLFALPVFLHLMELLETHSSLCSRRESLLVAKTALQLIGFLLEFSTKMELDSLLSLHFEFLVKVLTHILSLNQLELGLIRSVIKLVTMATLLFPSLRDLLVVEKLAKGLSQLRTRIRSWLSACKSYDQKSRVQLLLYDIKEALFAISEGKLPPTIHSNKASKLVDDNLSDVEEITIDLDTMDTDLGALSISDHDL